MAITRELCKRSLYQLSGVSVCQLSRVAQCLQLRRNSTVQDNMATEDVEARPFNEIPGPKGVYQWPVIGPLLLFKPFTKYTAETAHKMIDEMFDKYGPIIQVNLGKKIIFVSDPKDFETLYKYEGKYPVRPAISLSELYFKRNNLQSIFSMLSGEEWHSKRTPINRRMMKADSATHYLEPQNAVADDFVKILASQDLKNVDQADIFYRFASESIGVVTFNQRLGYLDNNSSQESVEFLEAAKSSFKQIIKAITGQSIAHVWYRNSTYREYERAFSLMFRNSNKHAQRAMEIIEQKKRDGTLDLDEPNLLLSLASEKNLSSYDVSTIMLALYMAGTDSTAKNLQVLFYNLAKNPDVQETLRKEILGIIGPDGPLTENALSKMTYLKACLKESFRIHYPSFAGTSRILPVDVVLSGYKVPAGTLVTMFNPRPARLNFDEPDRYLPDRWLRSNENRKKDTASNLIVLPFSHGPRNCIGRRFAVQEIYLATAKVLQKMKIDLEPESWDTQFKYTAFIEPERPLKFKFTQI